MVWKLSTTTQAEKDNIGCCGAFSGGEHVALEKEIKALWRTTLKRCLFDLLATKAPTLVIVGENDIIDISHSRELAQMLAKRKVGNYAGYRSHAAPITMPARQTN